MIDPKEFDEVDHTREDMIKLQSLKAKRATQILEDRENRIMELEHDTIIEEERKFQRNKKITDRIPQPLKTGARVISNVGHGAYDVAKKVGRGVQHVSNHLEKDRRSGRAATRSVPSLMGRGSGSSFGVNENWMKMGGGTNQHRGSSITVNENWGKLGNLSQKATKPKKSRRKPKFEYVKVRVRK